MTTATSIEQHAPSAGETRRQRRLESAAIFFTVAVLLHNLDHLRRGADATPADVFWLGSFAMVVEAAVVALVFIRHRLAPLAAVVAGFSLAAGYVFVHFTPGRDWLSDPLLAASAASVSRLVAALETVSAIVLGGVGLHVLRRGAAGRDGGVDASRFAHPVVIAMALGNVLIFVTAIATW